jgi:acetyl-CoA carboxylase biotin carboxyl carrier protein
MTRMYEKSVEASSKREGEGWVLASPSPGWFTPSLTDGDVVLRGHAIGEIEVLGRRTKIVAPEVQGMARESGAPRAVGYGDPLLVVDPSAQLGAVGTAGARHDDRTTAGGLVFRAPTSGRFYSRSTPEKPVFVSVGDELSAGATICLLEVMKTFNRVTYGGANLPERARVREILVTDGADVTAGDPLLALEAI